MDDSRVKTLPMTAAYSRLIVRRFGSTAARRAALLADAGVAAGSSGSRPEIVALDDEITVGAQLRQLAKLHAFASAGWGLELGAALDGVTHGAAAAVAVTAPSLGAALTALARYAPVRTPFIDLRATRGARGHELRIVETCRLGELRTAVLEMVLLSIQGVVEAALGRRMDAATFFMPAPRPAHWRLYARHFHAAVRFAGDVAKVELPAAWLALPCPLADRVAHRDACDRLEALRARLAGDFVDALVERVLDDGDVSPSLGAVAQRLRLSPRTLVRRLGERGTSFRALLENRRRARAAELLLRSRLSVSDIADRLGYEDPTNFGRACRRWFGVSPRAYRARAASAPVAAGGGLG